MRSAESEPAAPGPPLWAAALVFALSGAGALVIESIWMRWFRLVFGATAPAVTATLVAFFAGQALGAAMAARRAAGLRRPLRTYAYIEATAALAAFAVPALLSLAGAGSDRVYDSLRTTPAALNAVRLATALVATLPAAICFGASLPVLGQAMVGSPRALGARGGLLYGANILGAALGAALAGFGLPEQLGVLGTYMVGVTLLIAAALGALQLARNRIPADAARARPAAPADTAASAEPIAARGLLWLAALSGFGAFASQVLLTQAFALVLDQSVYAFASVLVVVLLSLALGAMITAAVERAGWLDPRSLAGFALAAAGLGLACFPALLFQATDGLHVLRSARPWPDYLLRSLALVARTAGPALLAAGLLLPATFALAARHGGAPRAPGASLGRLLTANTVGALLGAVAAPFALVPLLHPWGALTLLAVLYAGAAVLIPQPDPRSRILRDLCLGIGWVAVLGVANPLRVPLVRIEADEQLVRLHADASGVTAVVERNGELRIQIDNHYALGGSAELVHEERQGHLPLLLHGAPRRVAFVGTATGITAGAALAHPVERIHLVEIVPAVARLAAQTFGAFNRDVYRSPRSEIVLDDGRNFLRSTAQTFDVVVADLFVPWRSGTAALWSREHFAAVRERLAPGGLFCQWVPLYQLGEEEFRILVAGFLDVFPDAALFRGDFYGRFPIVALVGHVDGVAPESVVDGAARRLGEAGEADRWVTDPAGVWSLYVGPLAPLRGTLADVPHNLDDRPRIQFLAARRRAGQAAGDAGPFTGLAFQAFTEQLRSWVGRNGDALHPELSDRARRAAEGGQALQDAGALFVAGRQRESARRLAQAARLLPAQLLADAPADATAADLWPETP